MRHMKRNVHFIITKTEHKIGIHFEVLSHESNEKKRALYHYYHSLDILKTLKVALRLAHCDYWQC